MSTRLHCNTPLGVGLTITLDPTASRHLREALRVREGDAVVVFNGLGGEFTATVVSLQRGGVSVRLDTFSDIDRESPLRVRLAQGISRGERMDFTIQKAVELGVSSIAPLATERSTVRLDEARARKRAEHWQGIVRHAAEQSGRTRLPVLEPVQPIEQLLGNLPEQGRFLLDPAAGLSLGNVALPRTLCLAIGPEGGFSPLERQQLEAAGFQRLRLGPRILRTETAALVALSILQDHAGDLR